MTTAALAKIKCPEELSWTTLAQVCRLCLRNESIQFNILDDPSLHSRIGQFYDIEVIRSEKLPTRICHDCLLQLEIHSEFRQCVLQNEQRLQQFIQPKEQPETEEQKAEKTTEAVPPAEDVGDDSGLPVESEEFTEQELRTATVIDPNHIYEDSSDDDDDDDDDDADEDEEEGECEEGEDADSNADEAETVDKKVDNEEPAKSTAAILVSDDDEDEGEEDEDDDDTENLPDRHQSSILAQHLLHGSSGNSSNGGPGAGLWPPQLPNDRGPAHDSAKPCSFFLCQFCDLGFKFQENCSEHEQTKHDADLPYNCIFCLFCARQRVELQQHMRENHGFPKPFICTECRKGFTRRSDLRKHTIVHTGVRPYTCFVCQKSFSRNTNLTKHMRIHSGHKPFVCPQCPKTFVSAGDLERHQRIHAGIKPFACQLCPSTFTRRDKLNKHVQVVHVLKAGKPCAITDPTDAESLMALAANLPNFTATLTPQQKLLPQPTAIVAASGQPPAPLPLPPPPARDSDGANSHNNSGSSSQGMVIDLDPLTEMRPGNGMDMSQRILEAALMRGCMSLTNPNHFGPLLNLPEQLFAPTRQEQEMEDEADLQGTAIPLAPLPPQPSVQAPPQLDAFPIVTPPPPPAPTQAPAPPPPPAVLPPVASIISQQPLQSIPIIKERPFACPICGKRFPRKGELERHESVHTGARPFVCNVCPKTFSRKDKLVRHKRIHLATAGGGASVVVPSAGSRREPAEGGPVTLPQISISEALENYRRTEAARMATQSQPLPPPPQLLPLDAVRETERDLDRMIRNELKDFAFRPNFYSQINFGGGGGGDEGGSASGGDFAQDLSGRGAAGGGEPMLLDGGTMADVRRMMIKEEL